MRLLLLLLFVAVPGLSCAEDVKADAGASPGVLPPLVLPPSPDTVLPYGAPMTRPERVRGKVPPLTPDAIAQGAEGTFMMTCTVHVSGKVNDCRILRPLPYMDTALLKAAETWHFKPATLDGHPVTVRYTFTFQYTRPKKQG